MYLEDRMIAMLDVLGLSQQLTDKPSLISTANKYTKLIQETKEHQFLKQNMIENQPPISNFEVGEFVFDNLVLVSHPIDSQGAVFNFVNSVILIMRKFALADMPLRGAIGIGDYYQDTNTKIFLSNIFKELSREESYQEWSGCTILENAKDTIIDKLLGESSENAQTRSSIIIRMTPPSKGNILENRWCLNWMFGLSPSEKDKILTYIAGEPKKLEGTKKYISHVNNLQDDSKNLPPEFFPATSMIAMRAREGMRVVFLDAHGNPVKPGCSQFCISVTSDENSQPL